MNMFPDAQSSIVEFKDQISSQLVSDLNSKFSPRASRHFDYRAVMHKMRE